MNKLIGAFVLIAIVALSACKDKPVEEEAFINPPFPALNPEYQDFIFDATVGGSFVIDESGTSITVPPNIWSDTEGNPVNGNIKLKYREFHDAYDVFLSGADMQYDSAGVANNLQTAGMFELLAYKDSSEIFIAADKKLTVKMASYDADPDYNFYYLDENKRNWEYTGYEKPEVNSKIQSIRDTIEKLQPELVFPLSKDYFATDLQGLIDVYYREDWGKIRKNSNSGTLKNKFKSYGITWTKIWGSNPIKYHGRNYRAYEILWQNLSKSKIPSEKAGYDLRTIKYLGDDTYYMTMKNDKEKTLNLKVKAVMPLRALLAQNPDTWNENYETIMKQIREEEERLNMQAAVFRTYDVTGTGFHNWDKVYHREDKILVNADFKFDREVEQMMGDMDLYYFLENNKTFVKIDIDSRDSVMLVPDSTAKFLAVMSATEAAVFSSNEYNKLDLNALKSSGSHVFEMKTYKVSSKEELVKILN